MNNLEKYNKLFLDSFRVKPEDLPTLTYRGIPAWDSVGHMEFVSTLEEVFRGHNYRRNSLQPENPYLFRTGVSLQSYSTLLRRYGFSLYNSGFCKLR